MGSLFFSGIHMSSMILIEAWVAKMRNYLHQLFRENYIIIHKRNQIKWSLILVNYIIIHVLQYLYYFYICRYNCLDISCHLDLPILDTKIWNWQSGLHFCSNNLYLVCIHRWHWHFQFHQIWSNSCQSSKSTIHYRIFSEEQKRSMGFPWWHCPRHNRLEFGCIMNLYIWITWRIH